MASINSTPLKFQATLNNGANLTTSVPPSLTVPNFEALHLDAWMTWPASPATRCLAFPALSPAVTEGVGA